MRQVNAESRCEMRRLNKEIDTGEKISMRNKDKTVSKNQSQHHEPGTKKSTKQCQKIKANTMNQEQKKSTLAKKSRSEESKNQRMTRDTDDVILMSAEHGMTHRSMPRTHLPPYNLGQ